MINDRVPDPPTKAAVRPPLSAVLQRGVGESFVMPIEAGKVREFTTALRGYRFPRANAGVSVTFPTVVSFWLPHDIAPWAETGSSVAAALRAGQLIHGSQEFTYSEPLRVGEKLRVTQSVSDVYEKIGQRSGSMTFIEVTYDCRSADTGSHIVSMRSTMIMSAAMASVKASSGHQSIGRQTDNEPVYDEFVPFIDEPLTRTDFVRYQGASGDFSIPHHDEVYAAQMGMPSVFSLGMLQAGILGMYVSELFGSDNVRRFRVEFRELAWPEDVLRYRARVVGCETHDKGHDLLTLQLQVVKPNGAEHIRGSAQVVAENNYAVH